MSNIIEKQKQIPVVNMADVVVCGGGPSGLIAAISAARQGAETILIEKNGFLGGMATAGLVGPISNFRFDGDLIIKGIPWEFMQKVAKLKGAVINDPSGNVAFDPEIYKLVADNMVKSAGVKVLLYSTVVDVISEEKGKLSHIILENKSGRQAIGCKQVIDASGDGDIIARAGFSYNISELSKLQPVSLVFRLGGVDTGKLDPLYLGVGDAGGFNSKLREKMLAAREKGIDIPLFGGPWVVHGSIIRSGYVSVNATRRLCSCIDADELTNAQITLRKDMFSLFEFMKSFLPALKDSYILDSASSIGTRESRRIRGLYELGENDILHPVSFEDTIAKGSHPIDSHSSESSKQALTWLRQAYNIPYRSLIPVESKNVLVTGRSISATPQALASTRVQATCMALGQAAGTASALCANLKIPVADLNPKVLRTALKDQNAFI